MPSIETRDLRSGGRVVGQRYVVRVRDRDRGKYTSATFATRPEAELFVRDCDDRGTAWALVEYHRAKDEAAEPTLNEWAETHFSAITRANPATVAPDPRN